MEKRSELIKFPESYTIIDIETTGLSPKKDEIIEIACVKYNNNKVTSKLVTLIKPSKKITKKITEITGIENKMVEDVPTFEEIAKEVWEFLKDEILVAHNARFDVGFLYEKFSKTLKLNLDNEFIDTLPLCRQIYDFQSYKLEEIARLMMINSEHHRALSDCLVLKAVIDRITFKSKQENIKITIPINRISETIEGNLNDKLLSLIREIKRSEYEDYEQYEEALEICDELLDKELLTADICQKMAKICEKYEDYTEAISLYESAMAIDFELDYYDKIKRLEKKAYGF